MGSKLCQRQLCRDVATAATGKIVGGLVDSDSSSSLALRKEGVGPAPR